MIDGTNAYSMSGACFFDLAPSAGGEPYRILLFVPKGTPPEGGWPLLVTSDGNASFPFAVSSLVTQAPYPTATGVTWGVIAAIGYPGDEPYDGIRRSWDLAPPPGRAYPPFTEGGPAPVTGGADRFLQFIEGDLLPRLSQLLPLNPEHRSLFGHSFGGLFTLYSLFNRPSLFSRWIAASPSIYWEDFLLLKSEETRKDMSGMSSYVHLSAGEYEGDELAPFQRDNPDADKRLEEKKHIRTVFYAQEMAERLNAAPDGLRAEFELFPGETHMTVLGATINRAISIAFPVTR